MEHNLRATQRRPNGFRGPKDLGQLLEGAAPRLHIKEVNKGKLENVPEDEEEVVLPPGAGEGDARDKRVVEAGNVDAKVVKRHALCARLVAEALDGVELLEGRVAGGEDEAEDEDEGDDGLGLPGALDARRVVFVEDGLAVGPVDEVGGHEGAHDGEDDDDGARRDEELGPSAPFVRVDGAEDGAREADDVLHAVVEEPRVVVGDARALEHGGIVVGDGPVARPLPKDAHGEDEHGAVALLARVEEFAVVPPPFVRARHGYVFYHFFVFELDDRRVAAAFAVVFGHGVEGFLVSIIGD